MDDPEVNDYLNELGQRLVAAVPRRQVRFRVLRGHRPVDQCVRAAGRLHRRQHRADPARADRVGARQRARARDLARHAAPHRAHDRRAEGLDADVARRARAGGARVARPAAIPAARRRRRAIAARRRWRSRSSSTSRARTSTRPTASASSASSRPASTSTPWPRSWSACRTRRASTTATRPRTCARTRSPSSASPRRRRARRPTRIDRCADSLDFQHGARAAARATRATPRDAVAYFETALARAQVQQRSRRAVRPRRVVAARARTTRAPRSSSPSSRRSAPPHPMIEAMAGHVLMESGDLDAAIARFKAALARYPNKMQLVYDYPEALIKAQARRARRRRSPRQQLQRFPGDGPLHQIAARAYAEPDKRLQAAPAPGRVLRVAGQPAGRDHPVRARRQGQATATSTRSRWSTRGCAACARSCRTDRRT